MDILDESEFPPVFLQFNYTAEISENSAVGTIVLLVGTSDRDSVRQRELTSSPQKAAFPAVHSY